MGETVTMPIEIDGENAVWRVNPIDGEAGCRVGGGEDAGLVWGPWWERRV
jgi:hypothetical protein